MNQRWLSAARILAPAGAAAILALKRAAPQC
jgi:hypothetical protein